MYNDLEYLSVPLPEDIMKLKWYGDFARANHVIDMRLAKDIPTALRKRLELEKEILARMPLEYIYTAEEAAARLMDHVNDATAEELEKLRDEGAAEWIYVNGEVRYKDDFLENMIKTRPDIASRLKDPKLAEEYESNSRLLDETIAEMKEKGGLAYKMHIRASLKMKKLVEEKAGDHLQMDPEEIDFHQGEFYNKDGEKILSWEEFSRHCFAEVEHLATTGRWVGTREEKIIYSVTPIAGVCDVEVDEETGEARILQVVHCHDIGKVFNYPGARGQIVGGAVMALGGTTMEEFLMKDGHTVTPSFAEYLIPTAKDVPEKNEVVFYEENPAETCPQGAKAIGEHGMYVVGAAFSNALYEACGITILDIPITPEKILKALGKI